VVTSKWNDPLYHIIVEDGRISVRGQGHYVVTKTFTPLTMVAFRIFLLMFGWKASWAYQIKALIRRLLMVGAKPAPINFKRVIRFSHDDLSIEDQFTLDRWTQVKKVYLGDEIPSRYVPQARYFQSFELDVKGEYLSREDIESLNRDKKISIFRKPNLFKTQ